MWTLMASVAAYTVIFTMLIACAEHLAEPSALPRALAAHRVIPATAAVAWAVTAGEGLLGVAGIVALWQGGGGLAGAVLAGCAALLLIYVGYGLFVRTTGRSGPCGCSRLELPMTGWVVARAAILAGMALLAFAGADTILPLTRLDAALAIVLIAALTFALLLWHLPMAMHVPMPVHSGHTSGRGGLPG